MVINHLLNGMIIQVGEDMVPKVGRNFFNLELVPFNLSYPPQGNLVHIPRSKGKTKNIIL